MNVAGRLTAFGAGLVVAFAGAYAIAGALVPDSAVTAWEQDAGVTSHNGMAGHDDRAESAASPPGLSLAQDGYVLTPVQAPDVVGDSGELRFQILTPTNAPLTDYTESHDRDLHLIVVRNDGYGFRHVHPRLDETTGTWSVPWRWDAAGTYRLFADFTPADAGQLTLTRTLDVAGDFVPIRDSAVRTVDQVDGYTVSLAQSLVAGATAPLTLTIARDGSPVRNLEPYLGAFGHLVALRDGDLAYLHVHPEGAEPSAGRRGGPTIEFAVTAPTAGRYRLYLDFQIEGRIHTATFVVDAAAGRDGEHPGGH